MADLLTPQLRVPFQIIGNKVAEVEQNSLDDYAQNVATVLRYLIGQRSALQQFGISDQAFRQNGASVEAMLAAVKVWEPQATVTMVRSALDDLGIDYIDVNVGTGNA